MSRAFIKENEDQESYLEWQKLLRDREELLRILEKKKKYLLEDPAAGESGGSRLGDSG